MTELAVVDTGDADGPPIVWLGSLGSSTAMWDRQLAAFATRHRCLLVDHPGHGASPPTRGAHTIAGLGELVLDALDRRDVDRAHFVGLSLGAMVSMWIAAERAERAATVALLCTTARFDSVQPWHERVATVRAGGTAQVAAMIVDRWLSPGYAADHPDDVAALEAMVSSIDDESYVGCCQAIAAMDLHPLLPAISAPTLVVAGSLDPATPPAYAEAIAAAVPGSRLEIVEAAHFANWEQPDTVNRLLADHLDGSHL
jgi:3-oxoadipate enol-lactonase